MGSPRPPHPPKSTHGGMRIFLNGSLIFKATLGPIVEKCRLNAIFFGSLYSAPSTTTQEGFSADFCEVISFKDFQSSPRLPLLLSIKGGAVA